MEIDLPKKILTSVLNNRRLARLSCVLFLLLSTTFGVQAQASQDCPNSDFSMGNFTHWTGYVGNCCPVNINMGAPGIVAGRHTIMAPGTDPIVPALQLVPPGFPSSVRLGNSGAGYQAERLEYQLNVTPNNSLFIFSFAVVMQDPGHPAAEQPRFEIQVFDPMNQPIACTYYQVAAGNGIPGFQSQGSVRWRDWTQVGVDLSPYIGQQVRIRATTADCGYGGHYGYGYLTARCEPLQITVNYCIGDTIASLTAPNGFVQYQWSDGSSNQTIVINNPQPGQTQYTCTITSATGCQATLAAVVAPVTPFPGFTDSSLCNLQVVFTDTSYAMNGQVVGWAWKFGDGSPVDSSQNPVHTYPAPGQYMVTLVGISSAGCIDSITRPITIDPIAVPDFILPGPCGLTQTFTDNSTVPPPGTIVGYDWDFGAGGTSTQQNPSVSFPQPGTYDVTLVIESADGCRDTLVQPYTTVGTPVADFTSNNDCEGIGIPFVDNSSPDGDVITGYSWDFGDNNTGNGQQFTHQYAQPGTYQVQLIIQTQANCPDTISYPVTVYPNPVVDFDATTVCTGLFTDFTNNTTILSPDSIVQYAWDFAGQGNSNLDNPNHLFPVYGNYPVTLTATSNNGCIGSYTTPVQVFARPEIDFTADPNQGCMPLLVSIFDNSSVPDGSQIANYVWDMGDGTQLVGFNPSHLYDVQGTYSVTLTATSNQGCDTTLTLPNIITVFPLPKADFRYTPEHLTEVMHSAQFVNQTFGGDVYYWDMGDGTTYQSANPFHEFAQDTGTYMVYLHATNSFGCTDSIIHPVRINPSFTVFIPNTFTPNGDGYNETFNIHGRNIVDSEMWIFDRWGRQLLYQKNMEPIQKGWDGTLDRKPIKQDVYVYRIRVRDIFGDWHDFKGKVSLVR